MYNKILPNDHSEKKNDNLATGDYVRNKSYQIVSYQLNCILTICPLIANTDSHI